MITVAIDARPLARRHDGISRFVHEIVDHLSERADLKLLLLSHRKLLRNDWAGHTVVRVDDGWNRMPGTAWLAARFGSLAREMGAQIAWGTAHVLPPFALHRIPTVLTMHDLVHLRFPETMQWHNRLISAALVGRSVRRATRVACISAFTRDELLSLCRGVDPAKVRVIHNGGTPLPVAEPMTESLPARFLFCLGSLEPRKNLLQMVAVFARLVADDPDLHLVLAGGAQWQDSGLWQSIERHGLGGRVRFVGRVSDGQIRECLTRCQAFVFPSRYEGFGLPVLEAAGIAPRIVLNDIPALREVGCYAAAPVFCNFDDVDGAARCIAGTLARPAMSPEGMPPVRVRRWCDAADQYAELFHEVAGSATTT